jgi:S1-C subfamily serine protease
VDDLDVQQQNLEKTVAKAEKDLQSRLTDMVQQEVGGARRPRFVRPPQVRVQFEQRPFMGFDGQDIEPELAEQLKLKAKAGVLVTAVREGAPATAGGLEKNDVVQKLDGAEIKNFDDLKKGIAAKKPGDEVTVSVLRGEKAVDLKIKLGARQVPVNAEGGGGDR